MKISNQTVSTRGPVRVALRAAVWLLLLPALAAQAGHYECSAGETLSADQRRCSGGGIPMYKADEIRVESATPRSDERAPPPASAAAGGDLSPYFGVWRTSVPGAAWTSPSGYQGYDWLHVSAGVSAGDLIIRPDGTYLWASYGGKSGRWVRGDADYPIVLIDTVEKRRWKVGLDPKRTGGRELIVWDGDVYHYDGRR